MIYDNQCEATWERNKRDAEAICRQFCLQKNRGCQNLYLCCHKEGGSEEYRVFKPNHTVIPMFAYEKRFESAYNEEYDALFAGLKADGVDKVIIIANVKKFLDEEILEAVEGMILNWARYACLEHGIMITDIIFLDHEETESLKETDEYLRASHNNIWVGALDEFYGGTLSVR